MHSAYSMKSSFPNKALVYREIVMDTGKKKCHGWNDFIVVRWDDFSL